LGEVAMNWAWAMEELRAGGRVRYRHWLQGQSVYLCSERHRFTVVYEPGSEAAEIFKATAEPDFEIVPTVMFSDGWERAPASVTLLRAV
jgi:hypothetical protein